MSHLNSRFATTRWSVVQAAGAGLTSEEGNAALGDLCETYWYPLYAFVRRRGMQAADAQEAVQGFLAGLLDGNLFGVADADKGRFHSFLLKAFSNYLSDEGRKQRALKRGGGRAPLSLNVAEGEDRFLNEPASGETAEAIFDRKWALEVLNGAVQQLGDEFAAEGRLSLFQLLIPYMTHPACCPNCSSHVPTDSPLGLCPNCMLSVGFESRFGSAGTSEFRTKNPPPTPAELGPLFPELEIIEAVGRGGMGVVYRAKQRDLDRVVALKILRPDFGGDPSFAERFLREGRALAQLDHPNIITVHNVGHRGDLYFLIMEYVDGADLRLMQKNCRLTPAETLALIPPICDALQYAHEQGVVHRDIKPENILLTHSGRIKIADFGLAKLAGADESYTLTGTNQVMGTPHYMAPEQCERPQEVDHRADIYSLGVVIYELLTGELPIGRFSVPSESQGVDERLDDIVMRTLEKKPERRFQHASEITTAVENLANKPPVVARPHNGEWAKNWVEKFIERFRTIDWSKVASRAIERTCRVTSSVVANRKLIWARTVSLVKYAWEPFRSLRLGQAFLGLVLWSIMLTAMLLALVVTFVPPHLSLEDLTLSRITPRSEAYSELRIFTVKHAVLPRFVVLPSTTFGQSTHLEIYGPPIEGETKKAFLTVNFTDNEQESRLNTSNGSPTSVAWTPDVIRQWMLLVDVDVDTPANVAECAALFSMVNELNSQSSEVKRISGPAFPRRAVSLIDTSLFIATPGRGVRQRYATNWDDDVAAVLFTCAWLPGAAALLLIPITFWRFRDRPNPTGPNPTGPSRNDFENQLRVRGIIAFPMRVMSLVLPLAGMLQLAAAILIWQFDLCDATWLSSDTLVSISAAIAILTALIGVVCRQVAEKTGPISRGVGLACCGAAMLIPVVNLISFPYGFWGLTCLGSKNARPPRETTTPPKSD
jgi:serine/threonine protein kinase/DNA-directed RNA polymerase specialized sigma24 family protein